MKFFVGDVILLRQRVWNGARPIILISTVLAAFAVATEPRMFFKTAWDYRQTAIFATDASEGREAVAEIASDRSLDHINRCSMLSAIAIRAGNKETCLAAFDAVKSDPDSLVEIARFASDFDLVKLTIRKLVEMHDIGSLDSIRYYSRDPKVVGLVNAALKEIHDAWRRDSAN